MLTHQGGWDETLLIVLPILAIVGLLVLAQKRVQRHRPTYESEPVDDTTDPPQP